MRIRKANRNDIVSIMKFIEQNWKSNYILAKDRHFFEWQFVDGEDVHFIIAEDAGDIVGVQGYIPYNSYNNPDIAGSILKVKRTKNAMLGIEIVESIGEYLHHRWCASPGLSNRALKIEQLKGYEVPKLNHFYWLNENIEQYRIAIIYEKENENKKDILKVEMPNRYIYEWEEFEKIFPPDLLKDKVPLKDMNYLKWRYFEHPIYSYYIIMIGDEPEESGYYVVREVCSQNRKVAKIVDYLGNDSMIAMSYCCLDSMIKEEGYEYIDFYNYGLNKDVLIRGGFRELKEDSRNVIPNYFEPFVQSNVDVYFSKPKTENVYLFIGDGDQDRPSLPRK